MDWLKIGFAVIILISSQASLKYGNGLLASVIAAAPVIAFATYLSSSERSHMALQLAVFMLIGSITFFMIYLMPQKFFYIGILVWFIISILSYKFIF